MAKKPKLGEILVRAGVVDPDQLRSALGEQQRWGRRLGETLIGMGALEERDLVRALGTQLNLPVVHLAGKRIDPEILELIPYELAAKHGCLPLFVKQLDGVRTLHLGMEDPSDVEALDDARFRSGMPITPILVSPSDLRAALARSYGAGSPVDAAPADGDPREVVLAQVEEEHAARSLATERGASEDARAAELQARLGTVGSGELLQALSQLLVEKGLLERSDIAERILSLRSDEAGD